MLRLFPLSLVVLVLILLRLSCVHGLMSPAEADGQSAAAVGRVQLTPMPALPELKPNSPEVQEQVARLAREALGAPTAEARTAAALLAAGQSTAPIAQALAAVNAAEEVVIENVRQADTTGYKATRCDRPGGLSIDATQGPLKPTNRVLDVGIQGSGFFAVSLDDSRIGYTRCGNLFVDERNELVVGAGGGLAIVPPVHIPGGVINVWIGQDGTIEVQSPGDGAKRIVGRLLLTRFADPSALSRKDATILLPTEGSGAPVQAAPSEAGAGIIQQGFLEQSNVDLVAERLRLKFLNNWRAAIEAAIDAPAKPTFAGAK